MLSVKTKQKKINKQNSRRYFQCHEVFKAHNKSIV